jgi:DNA-binding protein H-NS
MPTLLERARQILENRSEEHERQYGDFDESIERTAQIATLLGQKEITPDDVYNVLVALKLARESHAHKEDNILDAIVYLAQKNKTKNNDNY